jgi:hypothetical protein
MNNTYFEKLSRQGFSTITSSLQRFVQNTYTLQFTTFFWCQSGEALITIDGYRFRFIQGSIAICPTGSNITVHDITSDFSTRFLGVSEDIWLAARCSFSPEVLQAITCRAYKGRGSANEQAFISNVFKQVEIIEEELLYANDADYCRKNIILSANAMLLFAQHAQSTSSAEQVKKDMGLEEKEKIFLQFRDLFLCQSFFQHLVFLLCLFSNAEKGYNTFNRGLWLLGFISNFCGLGKALLLYLMLFMSL